ncbi:NHLP leader peptide family RiPP precursor [Pleurocapsa sp. PCC 7319]|uniref:NHLP leader peptide family RiPP precursor n=1 Tax=Pleurocapsa sp. PCC 7319 TaxID=118161 RepID=UPI00034849FE|nr:NHLP leader peptide family RiPP precursor [Pleurocapsa sp. PCC 7319]
MENQQGANQNSQKSRTEIEATLVAKAWQNDDFRQELMSNPRKVFASEFNQEIPESTNIQVLEESNDTYYLVIPKKPDVSEELSDEALEAIAGGWYFVTNDDEGAIVGSDSN